MPSDPRPADADDQHASSESEDSDFVPDAGPEPPSDESDSEDASTAEGPSKRVHAETGARGVGEADGYDNSGDEAVILKGKKRRERAQEKGRLVDDEDGGQGGLIKTRAQRAAEKEERKYAVNNEPVTIDVDALWAQMMAGEPPKPSKEAVAAGENDETAAPQDGSERSAADAAQPDTIRIKRSYNFAGRLHTEEKAVARDSAEAKLYLASLDGRGAPADAADASSSPTRRATKKAFRSAFEPILDSGPARTDLNLGLAARVRASKEAQARKLTTVEKSRMDWAGFVDKEGIKDELELASKSKDSYAARQGFLARSEAIREDDARRARMSARV